MMNMEKLVVMVFARYNPHLNPQHRDTMILKKSYGSSLAYVLLVVSTSVLTLGSFLCFVGESYGRFIENHTFIQKLTESRAVI